MVLKRTSSTIAIENGLWFGGNFDGTSVEFDSILKFPVAIGFVTLSF